MKRLNVEIPDELFFKIELVSKMKKRKRREIVIEALCEHFKVSMLDQSGIDWADKLPMQFDEPE